jgi:hypothetical protein
MSMLIFLLIFLSILTSINPSQAGNLTFEEDRDLSFNLEQRVNGTGFFSTYKHAFMPDALGMPDRPFNGVESSTKTHGSGTIESDGEMSTESYYNYELYDDAEYDEDGEPYEESEDADSIISLKEDSAMMYRPRAMAIGRWHYAHHPIVFNSLLKDAVCIKNRDILGSMNRRVEGAHALDKAMSVEANYSSTLMNIDDDVTDGHIHIGAIQLAGTPVDEIDEEDAYGEIGVLSLALKSWKHPKIELEEDYVGSFHIIKNMSLMMDSSLEEEEEAWLPCCGGGWEDMLYYDRKGFGKSTEGVFNCACSR